MSQTNSAKLAHSVNVEESSSRRGPRTLCAMFQESLRDRPRPIAFQHKVDGQYVAVSSQEFADRVKVVSTALRQIGVQPGDRVGIIAPTCLEWAMADYAILHCGAVTVPVYPTLQADAVQHVLSDSEAMATFVMDSSLVARLGTPDDLPHLQNVIVFHGEVETDDSRPVMALRDFETRGAAAHDEQGFQNVWRNVQPGDLATLIYTSGTTGKPKGVMLTHENLVSNVLAMLRRLPLSTEDSCLSFLPLSHIFERTAGNFAMWYAGARINYAESVETVPQNLQEIRPTVLMSVPRLYEKMNGRVLAAMAEAPPLRRKLFEWATRVGRECVRREQRDETVPLGLALQRRLADKLVFSKLRQRLGGRMRFMISGGAPLAPSIAEFFHAAKLIILEGYGLTETSPVLTVNPMQRPRIGTVGPVLRGIEIKLDENGEILAKGPNIMQGYYNNPSATKEVLRDGWFHTGDVGEIDEYGYLRITDRIKDIIVTAGGKNVAPQGIENQLKASSIIAEAVVIGDKQKYLTALIVPTFDNVKALAQRQGVSVDSVAALVRQPEVRRAFTEAVDKVNSGLSSFERIKRFALLERELSLEEGEITPTLKVKRRIIAEKYASLIEALYADSPPEHICAARTGEPTNPHEPRAAAG